MDKNVVRNADRIRRKKLYEELSERLEEMILDGTFAPRDQLPPEREIMEAFGVGRPTVRQALAMLESRGLIRSSIGEQARVVEPSMESLIHGLSGAARFYIMRQDGVRHFQETREVFEGAIARVAARKAGPKEIEMLERALAANRNALGDPVEFQRTGANFHRTIAMMCDNPVFVAIANAVQAWLAPIRAHNDGSADRQSLAEHEEITAAIAAHDPDRAERAILAHLRHVLVPPTG